MQKRKYSKPEVGQFETLETGITVLTNQIRRCDTCYLTQRNGVVENRGLCVCSDHTGSGGGIERMLRISDTSN